MNLPHYPRTYHLEGSRVPAGEVNPEARPFRSEVQGWNLVIEEKVDGSHAGIGFSEDLDLGVFSRNTLLDMGSAGPVWGPLLQQTETHIDGLFDVLGTRYVLYGEWTYAKHAIFYDQLPAFFLEDDIYDRKTERFLTTAERREFTRRLPEPFSHSVPVLGQGVFQNLEQITSLVGPSAFQSPEWRTRLEQACAYAGVDPSEGSDLSGLMEGLYIKVEDNGFVAARYKWVRHEFVQAILTSGQHWKKRAVVRNASVPSASLA